MPIASFLCFNYGPNNKMISGLYLYNLRQLNKGIRKADLGSDQK